MYLLTPQYSLTRHTCHHATGIYRKINVMYCTYLVTLGEMSGSFDQLHLDEWACDLCLLLVDIIAPAAQGQHKSVIRQCNADK